jgi:hypothetical protein
MSWWHAAASASRAFAALPTWDFSSGTVPVGWTKTTAGGAYRCNAAGLLVQEGVNQLLLDYDMSTRVCRGVLVEPSATNYVVGSSAFNSWSTPGTVLNASIADPTGGTGAFTATAITSASEVYKLAATGASGPLLSSIYIRRRSGTGAIKIQNSANNGQIIVPITSSWSLIKNNGGTASANAYCDIYVTTVGDSVDIWGGQAARSEHSHIPTTTAAVTAPADVVQITVPMGANRFRVTREDLSYVDYSVTPGGTYTIPTTHAPLRIKSIQAFAS